MTCIKQDCNNEYFITGDWSQSKSSGERSIEIFPILSWVLSTVYPIQYWGLMGFMLLIFIIYIRRTSLVLWEWPRAESVPLCLNIIYLCLDALSTTLFQFAYALKTEKVNNWIRELIQSDSYQAPNTKGKDRQIQLSSHKMNRWFRWQSELATLSQKSNKSTTMKVPRWKGQ